MYLIVTFEIVVKLHNALCLAIDAVINNTPFRLQWGSGMQLMNVNNVITNLLIYQCKVIVAVCKCL